MRLPRMNCELLLGVSACACGDRSWKTSCEQRAASGVTVMAPTMGETMAHEISLIRSGRAQFVPGAAPIIPSTRDSLARSVSGKVVLMLLVGQAFRAPSNEGNPGLPTTTAHPCSNASTTWQQQREATLSQRRNLLDEFNRSGAAYIEVVMTFPQECRSHRHFLDAILHMLAPYPVSYAYIDTMPGQGDGVYAGYERVAQVVNRRQAEGLPGIDFVMQCRHDLMIEQPLTTWPLAGFRQPPRPVWTDSSYNVLKCIDGDEDELGKLPIKSLLPKLLSAAAFPHLANLSQRYPPPHDCDENLKPAQCGGPPLPWASMPFDNGCRETRCQTSIPYSF